MDAVPAARWARRFRPSLSWAVDEALFSYWRLPLHERIALDATVPAFDIHKADAPLRATLDWSGFLANLETDTDADVVSSSSRCIHVAWALALHAEATFDDVIAPKLSETKTALASDSVVVHGATVRRLFARLSIDEGDYYMAFVVLITVLEKALYDLYYNQLSGDTDETKKKSMILRDLLHSTELATVLPPGMMALLKILFLPTGLNLRNLVWHGFVVPTQFPRCFACLTALLLLELPRFFSDTHAPMEAMALFQLPSFDERFQIPPELKRVLAKLQEPEHLQALVALSCETSAFIPRGREGLVQRALKALVEDGDELTFLFGLLPVLEHAIRIQFVRTNAAHYGLALDDYCVAQIDQYYSTLDGFGQRDKHQVLLHAQLAGHDDPTTLNALYRTMPRAALAVCLDLFMMAAGPNVRAKLCHGEADLSTLLREYDTRPPRVSVISQLLLLSWISLCRAYDHERCGIDCSPVLSSFENAVTSSFHPFLQLRRLADACERRLTAFSALSAQWTNVRAIDISTDADAENLLRLEFVSSSESDKAAEILVGIVDKASRMREMSCFYDPTAVSVVPVKKPKTFVEYLVAFHTKTDGIVGQLRAHNDAAHSTVSLAASDPQVERSVLALSDADGLNVSACMVDILTSIDRSLASFEIRLLALASSIQAGTARTNQRRAFLNNVFFLPTFEQIQRLAFGLVVHQIHHLETVAVRRAAALGGFTAPALCPDARMFELLQRKLLQFITAFEGCTGSADGAQKSSDKALQLGLQFMESKAVRAALGVRIT